jgi:hypothetical protein
MPPIGERGQSFFAAASLFLFVLVLVLACHAEASARRLVLEKNISITITRTTTRTIVHRSAPAAGGILERFSVTQTPFSGTCKVITFAGQQFFRRAVNAKGLLQHTSGNRRQRHDFKGKFKFLFSCLKYLSRFFSSVV